MNNARLCSGCREFIDLREKHEAQTKQLNQLAEAVAMLWSEDRDLCLTDGQIMIAGVADDLAREIIAAKGGE